MSSTTARVNELHRVAAPVVADYLLSHVAVYALLPVLPVLLRQLQGGTSPWLIGACLLTFSFATRGASLFLAGFLHRCDMRRSISGGLGLASAAFLVFAVFPSILLAPPLLLVAGTGISINGLLSRVYIARNLNTASRRNSAFAVVQVAANVGSAIGPIVGSFSLAASGQVALLVPALLFLVAAGACMLILPRGQSPSAGDLRPPLNLAVVREVFIDRDVRALSILAASGFFLYAQFFSSMALAVSDATGSPAVRGGFFTVNAVMVIILLAPVARITHARLTRGATPFQLLCTGLLIFSCAFMALAVAPSGLTSMAIAVLIFSIGEALFSPMVNTAFAELPGERPLVEVFNIRQIGTSVGESLGTFAGGSFYLLSEQLNRSWVYWASVAALGAFGALSAASSRKRTDTTR